MKKFLFIAMFALANTVAADANIISTEYRQIKKSENIAEKLITIINDYTKNINAVESVYDLFFISEKCYKEKMAFEKNNAKEIAAFYSTLTKEKQTEYAEAIKSAMNESEAAVNRKAEALASEKNTTNEKK